MWEAVVAAAMGSAYAYIHAPVRPPKNSPESLGIRMRFIEPSIMDKPWFHPFACAGILSLFIAEAAAILA